MTKTLFRKFFWLLSVTLLIVTVIFALSVGRYAVPFDKVIAILASNIFPKTMMEEWCSWTNTQWRVVQLIRLPRVLIAGLSGAGLSLAGAALQGIFRNPLVGPQVLGVSSGAAFGGVLAILLFSSLFSVVCFAFVGGLFSIWLVYLLGKSQGQTHILMLILAGIVISTFFSALISLVTYFADPNNTLPAIVFWLMGSFASATFNKLLIILPPILLGCFIIYLLRFRINALSLGDENAAALGIAVEPSRWAILICVTLITSATVAISGTIGWVGLVIPHLVRMLTGPDHRILIPSCMIIGAIYMIIIDTLARTLTSAEIPIGIITAIIGAPIFVVLLRKTYAKGALHG